MSTHFVYSRCWSGGNREPHLQKEASGSRWACQKFIRERVRAGRPTHFLIVSSLDINRASLRYL